MSSYKRRHSLPFIGSPKINGDSRNTETMFCHRHEDIHLNITVRRQSTWQLSTLIRVSHADSVGKWLHPVLSCTASHEWQAVSKGATGSLHFTTHSLTRGAEPFLRSRQLCSYSRTSHHFMEPKGSLPCSQEPSTDPYPQPDQSTPYNPILSL
jgi:hypothetical protein